MAEYHNDCYHNCMGAGDLHRENEIKVAVTDLSAVEARLRCLGFQILHPRVFESNQIYDTAEAALRARGELLRIRQAGNRSIFTYKGRATITRHKEREELEVSIGDPQNLGTILERLGYIPRFRYEKYRTEWFIGDDEGIVMLDETPVGNFMELEGPPDWIDRTATLLGYAESDYLSLSYARLYAEDCARRGILPGDMVFEAVPVSSGA
jgi:adenylate cyclase, class 2